MCNSPGKIVINGLLWHIYIFFFFFEPISTAFNHIALNESFKMDYKEILPQE